MRSFGKVCDSSGEFKFNATLESEFVILAELIDAIAGSNIGQSLLQRVAGEPTSSSVLYDRLRSLLHVGTSAEVLGLTEKRLTKLQAAVELGKRLYCTIPRQGDVIDEPDKAAQVLQSSIGFERVEKFAVLVLDVKHRLLSREIISSGSIAETPAPPAEIFRSVILGNGCRCIVAHNHPSGSLEPSSGDLDLTKTLLTAAQCMGIPVIDHLIVSHGTYLSLRQTTNLWNEIPQRDT
jgi:DNA repair protein RadC